MKQNFIEDNIIILSKQTIDLFLAQDNPGELIALYTFYYQTAKWQRTNQIKASTSYTAKGLKWDEDKVRKFKKVLISLGLIEDFKRTNKETNKIEGWYIKINYIWKQENHPTEIPEGGSSQRVENSDPNSLSASSINSLAFSNENGEDHQSINNFQELIKKKRQQLRQRPKSNKINYKFQAYALEAAQIAGINKNRNRLFDVFKQHDYGFAQVEKTKEVILHPVFQKLATEDQKVRYLAGAYQKGL